MSRDKADLSKVAEKLDSFTPFPADESLRNIITGINASEDVNVQDLFEIGKALCRRWSDNRFSTTLTKGV